MKATLHIIKEVFNRICGTVACFIYVFYQSYHIIIGNKVEVTIDVYVPSKRSSVTKEEACKDLENT